MHFIENKSDAIKALQKMLDINQTGEYDNLTRSRVVNLQEKSSINPNGIVDYETHRAIYSAYQHKIIKETAMSSILDNPAYPYKLGDFGENVEKINILINDIFIDYSIETPLPKGKYFGNDTEKAILRLREIFAMKLHPYIDEELFIRMIREKKSMLNY